MKKIRRILSIVLALSLALSANTFVLTAKAAGRTIRVGTSSQAEFSSIQEALDSIAFSPTEGSRVTINIEPGTYTEPVKVSIPYVTFCNTDTTNAQKVVIAYDRANVHADDPSKSLGTQGSATVTVTKEAHDFTAENIIFENTYNLNQPKLGEDGGRAQTQAVAIVTLSDRVTFNNCSFLGRQDTLYLKGASKGGDVYGSANNARVYLKDCFIEGTVDYIFGDATAVFDNCTLNMAYYKNGGHYTAANTTLFNIGYVFINCTLTADKMLDSNASRVDLGRPWQADAAYPNYGSHTVFINCKMSDRIENYGFSLWNDSTVANKIRYYEYGTKNLKGEALDLSERAEYMKILTDEQAKAYTAENILTGDDGWNPENSLSVPDSFKVADITLNTYDVEIPRYSQYTIKACPLPQNAADREVSFESSNDDIASVNADGVVTANKKGECRITAVTKDGGFSAYANVKVTDAITAPPTIKNISLNKTDGIYPGDTLVISYDYALGSDDLIDDSLIKWYSGNTVVKQGPKDYAYYYDVQNYDIGNVIRAEVIPGTTTSYGNYGKSAGVSTAAVNKPLYNTPPVYIHEEFADINKIPFKEAKVEGAVEDDGPAFEIYSGKDYEALGSFSAEARLLVSDKDTPAEFSLKARMRANPEKTGMTASDSYDILTNYDPDTNSYYKFSILRGDNTNSLKLYVYESINGEETLLGSDETGAADKVAQNSGENNPFFDINAVVSSSRIKFTLTVQGDSSAAAKVLVDKENDLSGGKVGIMTYGKAGVLLMDNLIINGTDKTDKTYDENKIHIFLAGDSTVKTYGIERSTGGWGEYIDRYFDGSKVEIINKAEGGRSSRSFINQGRLDEIAEEIRPGDYLFIQFGHNDSSDDEKYLEERYCPIGTPDADGIYPVTPGTKVKTPDDLLALDTSYMYSDTYYSYDCGGTYKWYLKQFIDTAREKGAFPVLVTPVTRMYYNDKGVIRPHHDDDTSTDNAYVRAMKQLGAEENVPVLDLFGKTVSYYNEVGENKASLLHDVKADGNIDKTHHSKYGAFTVAGFLAELIKSSDIELKSFLKTPSETVSSDEGLKKANVFILGDSTACIYESDPTHAIPRGGWGMYLGDYMADSLNVQDLALSGRSSKSFTQEDNYQKFLDNVKTGDYVLIQFGHNDRKDSTEEDKENRWTNASGSKEMPGSFKYYLNNYYIKPAQEAGAFPILLTPVSELVFENGKIADTHGAYDDAVRELAAETETPLIDMTKLTANLYESMGEELSKNLFAYYNDGRELDTVHFNHFGGSTVAGIVADSILDDKSTLKNYVVPVVSSQAERGEFITDLMSIIGATDKPSDNFADIDPGKSYANAAGNAKALGVSAGDLNGNFNPEAPLTRQDMFTLTYNFLKAEGLEPENSGENVLDGYIDKDDVSSYARAPLSGLIADGIISGTKSKRLDPRRIASNADTAAVVNKVYNILRENDKVK